MRKYFLLSLLSLFFLAFTGCEDDTEDPTPGNGENTAPVANAGPDLDGEVGSTVTLDGSASSDEDEDDLTYLWEVNTSPDGSNASINDQTSATASFIPDEPGTYTITLTVDDGTETDADETIVEVEGDPQETVEVSSSIDEEVVWIDIFENPDVPDYYVTRDIDVNALLTIEPGVVVHMAEGAVITVETGGGTLIAEGTEDNKITFTSFDEPGEIHWGGLEINSRSSQNILNHVDFVFGGGEDLVYLGSGNYANPTIAVNENARLSITNTHVSRSAGDGLFVIRSGNMPTFSNNTFSEINGFPMSLSVNQIGSIDDSNNFGSDENGGNNQVRIYDSELEEDQEWSALSNNTAYLFQGDVSIEANLTIGEGVHMQFDDAVVFEVTTDGVLKALGTADNPVEFTSSNIEDGHKWGGILINSSSINNEMDHVHIAHAGGDDRFIYFGSGNYEGAGIGLVESARLKLTNTEISDSRENGLIVHSEASLEDFSANSFHNNGRYPVLLKASNVGKMDEATDFSGNAHDVVAIYKSTFDENALFADDGNPQWVALNGDAQYLITDELTVEDDLEIAAGADFAFSTDAYIEVTSSGSFKAIGTSGNPISFTAYEQDGNHNWGGIIVKSENTNNQFDYTEVSYGGTLDLLYVGSGTYLPANIAIDNNASLQVDNSQITNSKGYGISVHSNGSLTGKEEISYSSNAQGDLIED